MHSEAETNLLQVIDMVVGFEAVRFAGERSGVRGVFGAARRFFPVFDGLTFELDLTSSSVAIVGANGIGKTTLLRSLAGLVSCSGELRWRGKRLDELGVRERLHVVRFVPSQNAVLPSLSISEHFQLIAGDKGKRERALERFFDFVREEDASLLRSLEFLWSDQKAGDLSGGERKILSLSLMLLEDRSLLLLDEPTAGLSPKWLDLYSLFCRYFRSPGIIQAEQFNKISVLRSLGARVFQLKERSLERLEVL